MVAGLVATGALDETWRAAFEQVPRHLFIPEVLWLLDRQAGGRLRPFCREDDQTRWLELAYRDAPVDTQVDDGRPAPEGGWEVTSSASQPTVIWPTCWRRWTAGATSPGRRFYRQGPQRQHRTSPIPVGRRPSGRRGDRATPRRWDTHYVPGNWPRNWYTMAVSPWSSNRDRGGCSTRLPTHTHGGWAPARQG